MTSVALSIPKIFEGLEFFEKRLNIVGYIPFAGIFSGHIVRHYLGIAEILASLALLVFGQISFAFILAVNGVLNLIRGRIEFIPFISLGICLPFDLIFGRIFDYAALL